MYLCLQYRYSRNHYTFVTSLLLRLLSWGYHFSALSRDLILFVTICKRIKGAGGGLYEISLEIDFMIVSDRGSAIYQLLLAPWKNIVPSRSYRPSMQWSALMCNCIARAIFNRVP